MKEYTIQLNDYHAHVFEALAKDRQKLINRQSETKVLYSAADEITNFLVYDVLTDNDNFADRIFDQAEKHNIDFDDYNSETTTTMPQYIQTWPLLL